MQPISVKSAYFHARVLEMSLFTVKRSTSINKNNPEQHYTKQLIDDPSRSM